MSVNWHAIENLVASAAGDFNQLLQLHPFTAIYEGNLVVDTGSGVAATGWQKVPTTGLTVSVQASTAGTIGRVRIPLQAVTPNKAAPVVVTIKSGTSIIESVTVPAQMVNGPWQSATSKRVVGLGFTETPTAALPTTSEEGYDYSCCFVANGVALLGGGVQTVPGPSVVTLGSLYSIQLASDGAIQGWTVQTPLPVDCWFPILTYDPSGYVILADGQGTPSTGATGGVWTATCDPAGNVGAWQSQASLPIMPGSGVAYFLGGDGDGHVYIEVGGGERYVGTLSSGQVSAWEPLCLYPASPLVTEYCWPMGVAPAGSIIQPRGAASFSARLLQAGGAIAGWTLKPGVSPAYLTPALLSDGSSIVCQLGGGVTGNPPVTVAYGAAVDAVGQMALWNSVAPLATATVGPGGVIQQTASGVYSVSMFGSAWGSTYPPNYVPGCYGTLWEVPCLSVPLALTGLTPSGTYTLEIACPAASGIFQTETLNPIFAEVFDLAAVGPLEHLWGDGGAQWLWLDCHRQSGAPLSVVSVVGQDVTCQQPTVDPIFGTVQSVGPPGSPLVGAPATF